MKRYRVGPYAIGRWAKPRARYFDSLEDARQHANYVFQRTGCVVAIEELKQG